MEVDHVQFDEELAKILVLEAFTFDIETIGKDENVIETRWNALSLVPRYQLEVWSLNSYVHFGR